MTQLFADNGRPACFCGTDSPLLDGHCPSCGRGVEAIREEGRRRDLLEALAQERESVAAASDPRVPQLAEIDREISFLRSRRAEVEAADPLARLASIDHEIARLEALAPKP